MTSRRAMLKGTAAFAGLATLEVRSSHASSASHPHQVARLILAAARVGARN